VLQVEVSALPDALELAPGHARALVLFRFEGRPVGQAWCHAPAGRLDGPSLREAALEAAGERIAELRLGQYLARDHGAEVPGSGPSCTVAVCTRDRPRELARCLEAVAALPDDGQEVLVVDSASRDDAPRETVRRWPAVRYVREERPGLDVARNRALREARGEVVAFTDDDAAPDPGWLRALRRGFASPRTLCVTGLTLAAELETEAQEHFERLHGFGRGFRRVVHDGLASDAFFVHRVGAGANMALRRSALETIGPFDPALDAGTPTRSGGDHDYFTRILAAGHMIVYEPDALSWHWHRRDAEALRRTAWGYGAGVYAYLTRQLLAGELRAPLVAAQWLPWQLLRLWRALRGHAGSAPAAILWAELRGCAAGPAAYLRARRQARRSGA
jgi:GT2 family glycosyltransferase